MEKNLVIKVKCGGYIDNFLDRKDMHYYKDIKKEHLDKLEKINDFKLEKGKSYEVNIRLPIGEDSYLEDIILPCQVISNINDKYYKLEFNLNNENTSDYFEKKKI